MKVKLIWMSIQSLFVRGAPFLLTPSAAAHASLAQDAPAAVLGFNLAIETQVREFPCSVDHICSCEPSNNLLPICSLLWFRNPAVRQKHGKR